MLGAMPLLRYMVIDADGQRIGRFESSQLEWKPGDIFDLGERSWRIVEILPEVSTMVGYNAVWVATPI
jgi:Lhr-like helicase